MSKSGRAFIQIEELEETVAQLEAEKEKIWDIVSSDVAEDDIQGYSSKIIQIQKILFSSDRIALSEQKQPQTSIAEIEQMMEERLNIQIKPSGVVHIIGELGHLKRIITRKELIALLDKETAALSEQED